MLGCLWLIRFDILLCVTSERGVREKRGCHSPRVCRKKLYGPRTFHCIILRGLFSRIGTYGERGTATVHRWIGVIADYFLFIIDGPRFHEKLSPSSSFSVMVLS